MNSRHLNAVLISLLLGSGVLFLFVPLDVRADSQSRCDHPDIRIVHDAPAELDLACSALADVVAFFQDLGFTFTPTGALLFADRPIDDVSGNAPTHGHFDARRSQITAFRTSDASPWGQQWSWSLAGSFLRHELAHMAIWQIVTRESISLRPEWHEFIAYAIQLDLMDPDLRDVLFATRSGLQPFNDLIQVNEFTSRMDPEMFALAAYETYRDRGGENFVGQLLRAEIVPPEFIYPFPVLPGQTPVR